MPALPLPVRATGLFVAVAAWLMVLTALLGGDGLDAEGVATALKVAGTTAVVLALIELGVARRHPAAMLPALGAGVLVWCVVLDLVLVQVDALSLVTAFGLAVIAVATTGGEAWWRRSGRRGADPTT